MPDDKPLLMVTGLWKKKSTKSGEEFLTGAFTYGTQIFIFENKYKDKPTDPDFKMFIGAKVKQPDDSSAESLPVEEHTSLDDDIPF